MVEIAQEGPLAPTNQKLKESRRFSFLGQDVGAEELVPSCRGCPVEQASLWVPWRASEHQADLAMEANLMGLEGRRSLERWRTQTDKTLARRWRGRSSPSGKKKLRGSQFEDVQGRIPTRTWAFEELEDCREVTGQAKEARVEDILRPERRRLITSDTAVICKTRSKENMIRDDFDLNNKVAPTGKRIPPSKTIPRNAFLLPGAIEENFQFSVEQQSHLKQNASYLTNKPPIAAGQCWRQSSKAILLHSLKVLDFTVRRHERQQSMHRQKLCSKPRLD